MTRPWAGPAVTRARAALARTLPRPCHQCGQPVTPDQAWDLDHVLPRATHPHLTWDPTNWAVSHSRCNQSAGATAGNLARTRTARRTRPW